MKNPLPGNKLFAKFILSFSAIILIPIIILGSISYYRSKKQLEQQADELLEQIVKATSVQIDKVIADYKWLSNSILTSKKVYDFLDLEPGDYYGKLQFFNWINETSAKDYMMQKPYVDGITILSDSGLSYFDSKSDSAGNYSQREIKRFAELKDKLPEDGTIKVFISDFDSAGRSETDSFQITLGRRIISINSFKAKGSFFLNMRSAELSEIWKQVDLKGGFIWIVSDDIIIHHPDKSKLGMDVNDAIGIYSLSGGKGRFQDNRSNIEYYFRSVSAESTGWKIIATIPLSQLMKPADNIKNVIVFTSLFAFPCSLALGYLFIHSILKPIRGLRLRMIDAGRGMWNKLEGPVPNDEIGDLISGFNTMVDKLSDLVERVYKSELEQRKGELARKKAELQALQTQINPHFLYNTLGTINAYSEINDRESIQEMMDALGDMFRYAVQNSMERVKVTDEKEHVEMYLLIQRYRNRIMPKIVWESEGFEDYRILRLTLQPLIENAFKHGFAGGVEPHHEIRIRFKKKGGVLSVEVEDNGSGSAEDVCETHFINENKGVGLYNVHRRLQLAYGEKYGLTLKGDKGRGMIVRMHIPIHDKKTEDISF